MTSALRARWLLATLALAVLVAGHAARGGQARPTVTFRYTTERPARAVYLAGTFNDWQPRRNPMRGTGGGRTWTLALSLAPGGYQYKFVVDGTDWQTDPGAATVDDGSGNVNSVLWVAPGGAARTGAGGVLAAALLHDPTDPRFLNADEGRVYLSLRARRGDAVSPVVRFRSASGERSDAMELAGSDALYSYYRASAPDTACSYDFRIFGPSGSLYVSPEGVTSAPPRVRYRYAPQRDGRADPPPWLRDAVFYQILPDRFDNADPTNDPRSDRPLDSTGRRDTFFGGDLQGIDRRLPYLRALGIDALYLNPIFTSRTHHKYDTDDYQHVDPHLGGDAAFDRMARDAHADGLRLVLDGVFNHVGVGFFAFQDLLKRQQESPYRDWFFVQRYPVRLASPPNYTAWWGIPYMPKLNQGNPRVRRYLLDAAARWTERGRLDGWRLDAANEVDDRFWREFRDRIRGENARAALIGEIWTDASHWLKGDMFDSVMNYRWRGAVIDWIAHRRTRPSQFDAQIKAISADYTHRAVYSMFNMLGSHDTPRIRTECSGDLRRVRLAYLLQMTMPGAPCIYYGDEVAMDGGKDPDNRRPMVWNPSPEGRAMQSYVRAAIRMRRSLAALRHGKWRTLLADDARNLYAFARFGGGGPAVVAINNGTDLATVTVPTSNAGLSPVFSTDGPLPTVQHDGRSVRFALPAESGVVLSAR